MITNDKPLRNIVLRYELSAGGQLVRLSCGHEVPLPAEVAELTPMYYRCPLCAPWPR